MSAVIILFGIIMALAGMIICVNPGVLFGFLRRNLNNTLLQITAVVVRALLGILFIETADQSMFPAVMWILGWIFIVAAISLVIIGRKNFLKLMSWALTLENNFARVAGLFAILFGVFVIVAYL